MNHFKGISVYRPNIEPGNRYRQNGRYKNTYPDKQVNTSDQVIKVSGPVFPERRWTTSYGERILDALNKFQYIHRMHALQNIREVSIDKTRLKPRTSDILKLLGEQEGPAETHTTELVDQYLAECLQICTPRAAYIPAEALESENPGEIRIPGTRFYCGKVIQRMLRHSVNYIFFLATAGPGPELLARSLMDQGNYLEAYVVDLAASALVDLTADQLQEEVKTRMQSRGMMITNRYSPGYCDWSVEEQQKLFSLFPEECCGISLSESSLMNPIKSISGIIGAGTGVKYQDHICAICSMTDCHFRQWNQ
jgi:hypothetical protein